MSLYQNSVKSAACSKEALFFDQIPEIQSPTSVETRESPTPSPRVKQPLDEVFEYGDGIFLGDMVVTLEPYEYLLEMDEVPKDVERRLQKLGELKLGSSDEDGSEDSLSDSPDSNSDRGSVRKGLKDCGWQPTPFMNSCYGANRNFYMDQCSAFSVKQKTTGSQNKEYDPKNDFYKASSSKVQTGKKSLKANSRPFVENRDKTSGFGNTESFLESRQKTAPRFQRLNHFAAIRNY